jgi:hypothetical protein
MNLYWASNVYLITTRIKKMADSEVRVDQSAPILCDNAVVKNNICECYTTFKSELDDLKSELKSCKEIIRILYEDSQIVKSSPCAAEYSPNRVRIEKTQDKSCSQNEGWLNVIDRRRKPQNARRQPQRIPVHLSNRFTPLHNLNEDPEGQWLV